MLCQAPSLVTCFSGARSGFQRKSTNLRMAASTKDKVNIVAGATGYIGKAVVRESVRQGYTTVALVRDSKKVKSPEGKALYGLFFEGAEIVECDVTNPSHVKQVHYALVSCMQILSVPICT